MLLGSRARVSDEALARAAAEGPEFEFVVPPVSTGFAEALASCDLVVAKLGFSLLAECIAGAQAAALSTARQLPRRNNPCRLRWRSTSLPCSIPLDDFYSGNWVPHLRNLKSMPPVISPLPTNGARFCAEFLAEYALQR